MYSPTLGRFMQTDPIGRQSGQYLDRYLDGMNLYAYVQNDPVNGVDPTGMCTGSRIVNRDDGTCRAGGGLVAGPSNSPFAARDIARARAARSQGSAGRGGGEREATSSSYDPTPRQSVVQDPDVIVVTNNTVVQDPDVIVVRGNLDTIVVTGAWQSTVLANDSRRPSAWECVLIWIGLCGTTPDGEGGVEHSPEQLPERPSLPVPTPTPTQTPSPEANERATPPPPPRVPNLRCLRLRHPVLIAGCLVLS
jgi:hypothetical protein